MGVAEAGPNCSRDGRYQAGGFNFALVHDPVYAAVGADGHTLAWLEIVGTTDARCNLRRLCAGTISIRPCNNYAVHM